MLKTSKENNTMATVAKINKEKEARKAARAAKKAEALPRLANRRVNKAVQFIESVGNLAAYGPTASQKDAILKALTSALEYTESRFAGSAPVEAGFQLPTK
jgi:hypothetical protein